MLTQTTGKFAEHTALVYLRLHGLRLIARNFSCRLGEIDLIMAHRSKLQLRVLVFVEVRYRQTTAFGGPAASVTRSKQRRIIRTASRFLQTYPQYNSWPSRFDVVAISGSLLSPAIEWLTDAFEC